MARPEPEQQQLTVACVLWVGEERFRKRNYNPVWVQRLRNMVERNLKVSHRFVCLTNTEVPGVETIPLEDDLPGWWAKLEVFKHFLGDRVLFLDLDVLITGALDSIAFYPSKFALMPSSSVIKGHPRQGKKARKKGMIDRYQSSVMVWDGRRPKETCYDLFTPDVMERFRGDQDWIGYIEPNLDWFPAKWFAKLKNLENYTPSENHKVILSMPWKNAEAAKKFDWVKETWK